MRPFGNWLHHQQLLCVKRQSCKKWVLTFKKYLKKKYLEKAFNANYILYRDAKSEEHGCWVLYHAIACSTCTTYNSIIIAKIYGVWYWVKYFLLADHFYLSQYFPKARRKHISKQVMPQAWTGFLSGFNNGLISAGELETLYKRAWFFFNIACLQKWVILGQGR